MCHTLVLPIIQLFNVTTIQLFTVTCLYRQYSVVQCVPVLNERFGINMSLVPVVPSRRLCQRFFSNLLGFPPSQKSHFWSGFRTYLKLNCALFPLDTTENRSKIVIYQCMHSEIIKILFQKKYCTCFRRYSWYSCLAAFFSSSLK